jgi:hypothetical protein
MASIINGSSPTVTFSDGTTQATAGLTSSSALNASNVTTGTLPSAQLPVGTVLQVVQGSSTASTSTSSSTYQSTPLSVSITPKSATSKILILTAGAYADSGGATTACYAIARNGTAQTASEVLWYRSAGGSGYTMNITYLDSPATTSATTYAVYIRAISGTVYLGATGLGGNTTATITAMEIAA